MKTDGVRRLYEKVLSKVRIPLQVSDYSCVLGWMCGVKPTPSPHASFMPFALTWGLEHWRARSMDEQLKYIAVLMNCGVKGGPEYSDQFAEVLGIVESRIMALDAVLNQVCEERGFSAKEVREVAGAEQYTPLFDSTQADHRYQQQVKNLYDRLLFPRFE